MNHLLLLVALAILSGCSSLLPHPISHFEQQTPRPFAYQIGDEIHHRLIIETRKSVTLNPASLPKIGEINRWLQLNRCVVDQLDDTTTQIDLVYQVFYAANEVKMLSIPGFTLQLHQGGQLLEQRVEAWPFTLSPIKELAVRKDQNGLQYMRPDAIPAPRSSDRLQQGLLLSLSVATLIAGYLSYLYGYWPVWPKQRIFKQASRQLNRLATNQFAEALSTVHHALNTLYQQPLFAHQLTAFYQQQPQFKSIANQIDWFFGCSNRVLYAGQNSNEQDWQQLKQFCQLCREIECGRR